MSFWDLFNRPFVKQLKSHELRFQEIESKLSKHLARLVNIDQSLAEIETSIDVIEYEVLALKVKGFVKEPVKPIKTSEAIIDMLENSKKELHAKDIFDKLKTYNIPKKDISYNAFKATLYYLRNQKRIRHGKEKGCFRANRKAE